jgi:hypothetical protein
VRPKAKREAAALAQHKKKKFLDSLEPDGGGKAGGSSKGAAAKEVKIKETVGGFKMQGKLSSTSGAVDAKVRRLGDDSSDDDEDGSDWGLEEEEEEEEREALLWKR